MPPQKIAYVDECGIDTYLYREYGYAPQGQKVPGLISGRKYKRCGIVAAKMEDKILAPFQYSGTMDSRLFESWFVSQLLPSLDKGTVIVNGQRLVPFKKTAAFCCPKCRVQAGVLPPYSPELSPIENFWGWLKRFLRKTLPSHSSFDDALYTAFQLC